MKRRVYEIEIEEVVKRIHKITVEVAPCSDIDEICDAIDLSSSIDDIGQSVHSNGGEIRYLTEDTGTTEVYVLSYDEVI